MDHATESYVLHLADNALILAQRNAEWCGHGPVLEEDLAMANQSLDLIGQARLLYQYVAGARGGDCTEDRLAYFRDEQEFTNFTLLELPHNTSLLSTHRAPRDYAVTIVRNFLYGVYAVLLWDGLTRSTDARLAEIAAKALKETHYHLRHASDWLERLGDGTDESHGRMQAALDDLMPYTQEFWAPHPGFAALVSRGVAPDMRAQRAAWDAAVAQALVRATLARPSEAGHVPTGSRGVHSEHMGFLLAEMQSLARAHPEAVW